MLVCKSTSTILVCNITTPIIFSFSFSMIKEQLNIWNKPARRVKLYGDVYNTMFLLPFRIQWMSTHVVENTHPAPSPAQLLSRPRLLSPGSHPSLLSPRRLRSATPSCCWETKVDGCTRYDSDHLMLRIAPHWGQTCKLCFRITRPLSISKSIMAKISMENWHLKTVYCH